MTSSGTYGFAPTNFSLIIEAFDRIPDRPPELTQHQILSARTSLNLEMISWENAGLNGWKIVVGTINLVAGTATYSLPANVVMLTDLLYTTVNGGGAGVNSDRIMTPIAKSQYAEITNKLQAGTPSQYWLDLLMPQPQVTIWQPPAVGAPTNILSYYGLQQTQDAGIGGGETPDAPRRAFDALAARLTLRLAEKFGPKDPQAREGLMKEKAMIAEQAWDLFTRRDQDMGAIKIQPNISGYARIRRR